MIVKKPSYRPLLAILIACAFLFITACKKDSWSLDDLNISYLVEDGSSYSLMNVRLASGESNSVPAECFLVGGNVFDHLNNLFGYVGCDSTFYLVDPSNGAVVSTYSFDRIPQACHLRPEDSLLICTGYNGATNYILTVNYFTGLGYREVDIGLQDRLVCGEVVKPSENQVAFMKPDSVFHSFDMETGSSMSIVPLSKFIFNIAYYEQRNLLIGMWTLLDPIDWYVYALDAGNGHIVHEFLLDRSDDGFPICNFSFEEHSGLYTLIFGDGTVLVIDVSEEETVAQYHLPDAPAFFEFWRQR